MNIVSEFCTGCGLCISEYGLKYSYDEKGFLTPYSSDNKKVNQDLKNICPFGKTGIKDVSGIWGDYINVFSGYSSDIKIRHNASSGGVITALCCYLLEKGYVDGVIQTKVGRNSPFACETVCSRSVEEVKACMGSRYSSSSPLKELASLVKENEKYIFVGKPCDVSTLRKYMSNTGKYEEQIIYLFSFFCAGMPSKQANTLLISELGCDINKCVSLKYRGEGWPGLTVARDDENQEYYMEYQQSWMEILGRDIRKSCKLCFDGIGDFADVSCGDLWNLRLDNTPDFTETEGINIVFARTQRGNELLEMAKKDMIIELKFMNQNISTLRFSQPNHYNKRSTILAKVLALRLLGKKSPEYSIKKMVKFARMSTKRELLRTFKGAIGRCLKKKL